MGYGDTVPATGFISAGMTYEKGASPISERAYEQYLDPVGVALGGQPKTRSSRMGRRLARGLPPGP